jgi:hypothetical protein
MNIEICKKCPKYPFFFSEIKGFYVNDENYSIVFGVNKRGIGTGCSIFIRKNLLNKDVSFLSSNLLKEAKGTTDCPYLFEHAATNGD